MPPEHALPQRRLFCCCGRDRPFSAGLCRSCYRAVRHSRERFAGLRDEILTRDGHRCRACGAGDRLHVHHRKQLQLPVAA